MIELRKMENQNFRTFGWVQDPSDFESLIKVVSIFDNKSEKSKTLSKFKISIDETNTTGIKDIVIAVLICINPIFF